MLESGLDWEIGDQIVIAPTNYRTMDTDVLTISDITDDGDNTLITVETAVQGYHFGALESTASTY